MSLPAYTTPGVYVEEAPLPGRRITLVPTHVAAFVGPTRRGPLEGAPPMLGSVADFERVYGGAQPLWLDDGTGGVAPHTNHMALAVRAFFDNGGARLYVQRTAGAATVASAPLHLETVPADRTIVIHAATPGRLGNGTVRLRERASPVTLRAMTHAEPGTVLRTANADGTVECVADAQGRWHDRRGRRVAHGRVGVSRILSVELECFDAEGLPLGSWTGLALSALHPRWVGAVLSREAAAGGRAAVWWALGPAVDAWTLLDAVRAQVPDADGQAPVALAGGTDGALPPLGTADEPGSYAAGLATLGRLGDVRLVAAPGSSLRADGAALRAALVAHAGAPRAWRMALLDPAPGLTLAEVQVQRAEVDSPHAALHWPCLVVADPLPPPGVVGATITVPPSGAVAGLYAHADLQWGAHHTPANQPVRGVVRAEQPVSASEQDQLNPRGINCFREFIGRGLVLWGGRTTSSQSQWRYVNVRRYVDAVEASLDAGLRWVAFERQGEAVWAQVRAAVDDFLLGQWREGALQGGRANEAWWVQCAAGRTMTADDIAQGRVVCDIGIALLRPAEFVVLRWVGLTAGALQPGG
ncbi:MAG: phage tail sheath subtilisin-like domain-containing protein [Pseudomonadota bacterium]|nr:phage tail sheath subtilisin-like domain-containing protein [Pseudomonadota bacterium]